MKPRNVLFTEPRFFPLAQQLAPDAPNLEFRTVPFRELSADDLAWADTWIGYRLPPMTPESNIRWYHSIARGIEHVHEHFPLMHEQGAILTNTIGSMPHRIAEYVVATVLGHVRQLPLYSELQKQAHWERHTPTTAQDFRVTVVGTGSIGSEIGRKMAPFVSQVRGLSRSGRAVAGFDAVATLESGEFVDDADVLVLVLPLTPQTEGLVGRTILSKLPGAIVVNVGRGQTLDSGALREAIEAGQVSHAIVDVFEEEPLPSGDWRWEDSRVTVTPHISALTTLDDVREDFLANLRALEAGKPLPTQVELDGWY
ncbi:MAG: D-2-hydroxyacid dehydrogenase [Actinomycetaceae bacterium]|nr:D-2-hydroxyacid dehydrogenase [Actinomycetaceae bacterium]